MESEVEQILIGSLLGDGSIQSKLNKNGTLRCIYRENHSIKQEKYALFKIDKLNNILKIRYSYTFQDYKGNKIKQISFWSKKSDLLLKEYLNFYDNKKKIVSRQILERLTLLGIAIWFLDDGSYSYNCHNIILSTESFSYEQNMIITDYFKNKYGIQFIITPNGKNYRLRLNVEDTKTFIELIKPYVCEGMEYKLGLDREKAIQKKQLLKLINKRYYQKNKINLLSKVNKYYSINSEKIKQQKIEHRRKNIDFFHKKEKEYRAKNKSRIQENNRKYYQKVNLKDNLGRLLK